MHNSYDDIMELAEKYNDIMRVQGGERIEPQWWDENGVPRFCAHHPRNCPDIYAHEVVLLRIACQACGKQFDVQVSDSSIQQVTALVKISDEQARSLAANEMVRRNRLASQIQEGSIHYGDPPNVDCCGAGATMSCDDFRVLEYWRRDKFEWERDASLEISLPDGGGDQ